MTVPTWTQIAAEKKAQQLALIPKEWLLTKPFSLSVEEGGALNVMDVPEKCGILSAKELEITELDAPALVAKLASGSYTAVEVTTAFCKRAAIAQQLTNCLTEIFFEEALSVAAELDKTFKESGVTGPLHGLPVSLKDNFRVKGVDSTVGFIGWCNEPDTYESVMTELLRKQGAVLFVKTNVPTAMMIAESYNNVWGYTCNPLNRNLTSGGSSGGESALLKLKGSPLGVGTDIGGSIRIPSSLTGLYSLKPSFGRFPTHGARSAMPGQEAILSINGPMSSSLESVQLWAKTVVDSQPWLEDPRMIPIPWREVSLPTKLTIGVISDDGVVKPTPPIQRAVKETVAALKAAGHEVIEFPLMPNHSRGPPLLNDLFLADGGHHIKSFIGLSDEPWPVGLAQYAQTPIESELKAHQMWAFQTERNYYAKDMCDQWNATAKLTSTGKPVDCVIMPVTPFAGAPKYEFRGYVGYTGIWNVCDYPSATFPVGNVDPATDIPEEGYTPRNAFDKGVHEIYSAERVAGAPLSLQCVGRRLEEEKVLAMTKVIAEALKA